MPDLTYHDPSEVDGADDVSFPSHAHHFKVRAELTDLVELGIISDDEADNLYDQWRAERNQ